MRASEREEERERKRERERERGGGEKESERETKRERLRVGGREADNRYVRTWLDLQADGVTGVWVREWLNKLFWQKWILRLLKSANSCQIISFFVFRISVPSRLLSQIFFSVLRKMWFRIVINKPTYLEHFFFIIIPPFRVFHTSVSRRFLTGVWVTASLQDSSQYSGRSQQCFSLDGLHSSSYFQVFQFSYQFFGECTKSSNYNWCKRHFYVRQFFQFPSKVQVLILLFYFLSVSFCSQPGQHIPQFVKFSFFFFFFCCCWLLRGMFVYPRLGDPFLSQNPCGVCASHSPVHILGCACTICSYGQTSISGTIPSGSPRPHSRV